MAKRAELIENGCNRSILLVKPAFKAFAEGSPVTSGELLTFVTKKNINASPYTLHVSALEELRNDRALVARALKTDHKYIVGGQEINFTSAEHRPTMFRAMLFDSSKPTSEQPVWLRGEDVVTLYHKNMSAFLHYDVSTHEDPVFYSSNRVSNRARKKCSWMFKIERIEVMRAASKITATEDCKIRLKHLVSNKYLTQRGSNLGITDEYLDESTLFTLKQFQRRADTETILHEDLIFLRSDSTGEWLTLADEDDDDDVRTMPAFFRRVDTAPDSEALIVLPVSDGALRNVVQLRRLLLTLIDYKNELCELPDCPVGSPSPKTRDPHSLHVFEVINECYDGLVNVLRILVVNLTLSSDMDPMSRDGVPNKLMQKMLRELGIIPLIVDLVELPFRKGLSLNDLQAEGSDSKKLVQIMNLSYRLLKNMAKENLRNAKEEYKYLNIFRSHLGKGVLVTPTIKEIFAGKRELIKQINHGLVDQFVELLKVIPAEITCIDACNLRYQYDTLVT